MNKAPSQTSFPEVFKVSHAIDAIDAKDLDKVDELLNELMKNKEFDINALALGETATLLMLACSVGYLPVVKLLVEKYGASVDFANKMKETPLYYYIYSKGNVVEVVKYLLDQKANPNQIRDDGMSLLNLTVISQNLDVVNALLLAGADVSELSEKNRKDLLWLATASNHWLAVLMLALERGVNLDIIDDEKATPLCKAAHSGHTDTARVLLLFRANPQPPQCVLVLLPINAASMKGHTEILKLLVAFNVDPSPQIRQPTLNAVCKTGDMEPVKYLLGVINERSILDFYIRPGYAPDITTLLKAAKEKIGLNPKPATALPSLTETHQTVVRIIVESLVKNYANLMPLALLFSIVKRTINWQFPPIALKQKCALVNLEGTITLLKETKTLMLGKAMILLEDTQPLIPENPDNHSSLKIKRILRQLHRNENALSFMIREGVYKEFLPLTQLILSELKATIKCIFGLLTPDQQQQVSLLFAPKVFFQSPVAEPSGDAEPLETTQSHIMADVDFPPKYNHPS